MELKEAQTLIGRIRQEINQVLVGKPQVLDQLLTALIASGHVLLEDVPGTGKTLLSKTLAKSLNCDFKRIQFTPDLLPSDLSGIHFFNQQTSQFEFRAGPLFTNILLGDEINRATPRTQSSLLECMEELQVTIDGETMPLKQPFMVIATQNPIESQGTFPLPEAQLDRFLMKISMGYPTAEESVTILKRFQRSNPIEETQAVADANQLREIQQYCKQIRVSEDLYRYIAAIAERSRSHPDVRIGVSPRGMQALLKAAQARALLHGRDFVVPDDVKENAVPVLSHRLVLNRFTGGQGGGADAVIKDVLSQVDVPTENMVGNK